MYAYCAYKLQGAFPASVNCKTLWVPLVFALLLCVSESAYADEVSLSANLSKLSNGNTEISLQNYGNSKLTIMSIVLNRKEDNPVCRLRAYESDTGSIWFARSDISDEKLSALSMKPVESVTLSFGDEVDAIAARACGSILKLWVMVEQGKLVFTKE